MLTEPNRLSDWLKGEADNLFSREECTVLSGQNLKSGTVIGKVAIGAVTGAAQAGNTGNGTIGTLSAGTGAQIGVYTAVCIEPAANAGTFEVQDPAGVVVGVATVAVAFAGEVNFTIADGATDFVAGDRFNITVAAGTGKVKASPETGSDGSEVAAGILLYDVDASAADVKGVIVVRDAIVSQLGLTFDSSIDNGTKQAAKMAQLAALRILQRDAA